MSALIFIGGMLFGGAIVLGGILTARKVGNNMKLSDHLTVLHNKSQNIGSSASIQNAITLVNETITAARLIEYQNAVLRSALTGLVGTDVKEELIEMEQLVSRVPGINNDPATHAQVMVSVNAIRALIETA